VVTTALTKWFEKISAYFVAMQKKLRGCAGGEIEWQALHSQFLPKTNERTDGLRGRRTCRDCQLLIQQRD
jgi:hypothetical protein